MLLLELLGDFRFVQRIRFAVELREERHALRKSRVGSVGDESPIRRDGPWLGGASLTTIVIMELYSGEDCIDTRGLRRTAQVSELERRRVEDAERDVQSRPAAEIHLERVMPARKQSRHRHRSFRHEGIGRAVDNRQQQALAFQILVAHLHSPNLIPDWVARARHRAGRRLGRELERRLARRFARDKGGRSLLRRRSLLHHRQILRLPHVHHYRYRLILTRNPREPA
mmetsp:Transcript_30796/g.100267  ORF Transcript_30796/g.100267 Transcript_30796/m.100267 type:complete len:227 (+) Transcript_30796:1815-2495(+)